MAKFRISGVPITEGKKLVGIITNRDLKFETDFTKKIKESMTSEGLITAKEGITLDEAKKILAKARKEKLPIVDDDFNLKGLITIKDIEKTIKYPLAAKDAQGRLLCGAGVGITANVLDLSLIHILSAGSCDPKALSGPDWGVRWQKNGSARMGKNLWGRQPACAGL